MAKKHSRPEQLKIAGTERRDRVPELDALAEEYRDIDDQYQGLRVEKNDLADKLIAVMLERNITQYVYEDRGGRLQRITMEELDVKVKIKQVKTGRVEGAAEPEARN